MRCLMCGKEKGEGSLADILFRDDPLCSSCRAMWKHRPIRFELDGIRCDADYLYDEGFAHFLLQYKECHDEELRHVFLYGLVAKLRLRYHGSTLCLMPSDVKKQEERGFSHLAGIFECLRLPILEPFEKVGMVNQVNKDWHARENMMHAIRLKDGVSLPHSIVLCDDTITSGSTLRGALSCFDVKSHAVRVYCVSANHHWYGF